jgi:hypothetical protein
MAVSSAAPLLPEHPASASRQTSASFPRIVVRNEPKNLLRIIHVANFDSSEAVTEA